MRRRLVIAAAGLGAVLVCGTLLLVTSGEAPQGPRRACGRLPLRETR
ncbi:hypothetical protein [Nonomuraea dietziae]